MLKWFFFEIVSLLLFSAFSFGQTLPTIEYEPGKRGNGDLDALWSDVSTFAPEITHVLRRSDRVADITLSNQLELSLYSDESAGQHRFVIWALYPLDHDAMTPGKRLQLPWQTLALGEVARDLYDLYSGGFKTKSRLGGWQVQIPSPEGDKRQSLAVVRDFITQYNAKHPPPTVVPAETCEGAGS